MKYIHVACIVSGAVVPVIPVIAIMVDFSKQVPTNVGLMAANVTFVSGGFGFVLSRFPPILCFGLGVTVTFYAILLPIIIVFLVGIAELIFLFAAIHKVRSASVMSFIIMVPNELRPMDGDHKKWRLFLCQ